MQEFFGVWIVDLSCKKKFPDCVLPIFFLNTKLKRNKMALDAEASFGIITFGGSDVRGPHFLRVNGSVGNTTDIGVNSVGNSFIAGVPMHLFALTCQKTGDATIHVLRNGIFAKEIIVYRDIFGFDLVLARGNVMQVRSVANPHRTPPGDILMSFYFRPLPEQMPLFRSLQSNCAIILTFAGTNNTSNNTYLKFNGDVTAALNANDSDPANTCIISSSMFIKRMTWHKSRVGNDVRITAPDWQTTVELDEISGVVDINPPFLFKIGDVIRVQNVVKSGPVQPGTTIVSFYGALHPRADNRLE
jgi:hypothetical protein